MRGAIGSIVATAMATTYSDPTSGPKTVSQLERIPGLPTDRLDNSEIHALRSRQLDETIKLLARAAELAGGKAI